MHIQTYKKTLSIGIKKKNATAIRILNLVEIAKFLRNKEITEPPPPHTNVAEVSGKSGVTRDDVNRSVSLCRSLVTMDYARRARESFSFCFSSQTFSQHWVKHLNNGK